MKDWSCLTGQRYYLRKAEALLLSPFSLSYRGPVSFKFEDWSVKSNSEILFFFFLEKEEQKNGKSENSRKILRWLGVTGYVLLVIFWDYLEKRR